MGESQWQVPRRTCADLELKKSSSIYVSVFKNAGKNPDKVGRVAPDRNATERRALEEDCGVMAKRRGNPNWGKPQMNAPPTIVEFERITREFKLRPDQYLRSTRLREWASRNQKSKYIPEALLEAWGFEIEETN
jgi:hypothetical protein